MERLPNVDSSAPLVPEHLNKHKTELENYLKSLGNLKIEYVASKQPEIWAAAVSLAGASLAAIATQEQSS